MLVNDYDVGAIFQDIEIELIKSMKRTLGAHEAWEKAEGFQWEQWQAKKIREIRRYRAHNMSIMSSYTDKLDKAIKEDLRKQFLEGGRKVDNEIKKAIEKGFKLSQGTPSDDFFQGNNSKLGRLINAINNDFKDAQNAALRQMDDVYRKTIFKTEVYLGSGATTVDKAIDMATKDFLAAGINCITYADGRNINIASYAQMAVRTANKRVYLMGEGERRKEWGVSLVLVSQYMQCSPLCLPWQGKIYIDDVYSGGSVTDGDYPLLSTAISGHLFHPNCRHTMSTYFEGINDPPELMDKEEIGVAYEKAKQQTGINRNIQKYKRLKEGSQDTENIKKYDSKLKEWQAKKDDISKNKLNRIVMPDGTSRNAIVEQYGDIKIVQPSDLDMNLQQITSQDVKNYIDQIPSEYQYLIKEVHVFDTYDTDGSKVYKNAVAGFNLENKNIEFYRNSKFSKEELSTILPKSMAHEVGHALEETLGDKFLKDWKTAIKADEGYITDYAKTDIHEDFAETIKHYWSTDRLDRRTVEMFFPERFKVLQKYKIAQGGMDG